MFPLYLEVQWNLTLKVKQQNYIRALIYICFKKKKKEQVNFIAQLLIE